MRRNLSLLQDNSLKLGLFAGVASKAVFYCCNKLSTLDVILNGGFIVGCGLFVIGNDRWCERKIYSVLIWFGGGLIVGRLITNVSYQLSKILYKNRKTIVEKLE